MTDYNSYLEYNDNPIRRKGEQYCLTDMAKPYTKNLNDWLRLSGTKAYNEAVARVTGYPVSSILSVEHGKPAYAHLYVTLPKRYTLDLMRRVYRKNGEMRLQTISE